MAKLSVSVDVPIPAEQAWQHASDLSRYSEWLTIHRVWRSKLPDTLDKGTVVDSIVEVKGMPNRVRWTIVNFKPPEAMTLNGAVNKVLRTPDMQRTLLEQGMVTQVGSAADFDKMYRDDYVTLGAQIKTLGMTAE